eukprot:scaffold6553_cov67-Phaeocystis_antarctica.AAC.5
MSRRRTRTQKSHTDRDIDSEAWQPPLAATLATTALETCDGAWLGARRARKFSGYTPSGC